MQNLTQENVVQNGLVTLFVDFPNNDEKIIWKYLISDCFIYIL